MGNTNIGWQLRENRCFGCGTEFDGNGFERHAVAWKRSSERNVYPVECAVHEKGGWALQKDRQDTHTPISQRVSSNVKRTKRNRSLRTWPKWVLAERCVYWPINDHDSEYTLCFTWRCHEHQKSPSWFSPLTHANGSQSGFRRTRVAPRLKCGRYSRCILKWYGRAKKGVDVSG